MDARSTPKIPDQVIIGGGQALAGLALLMILTGITLGSALKSYASFLRKSLDKQEPLRSTGIGSPEDEPKLLPNSQVASVSSVTEHTTELLMAEGKRRIKDA